MLVHHGDAILQTMSRTREPNLCPVAQHCTFVGFIQTTQHRCQRALACAIFSKQGMHFAGQQVEINVIVGENARKTFGDVSSRERKEGRTA